VKSFLPIFALLAFFVAQLPAAAEEPLVKPNDVIALIGGEEMLLLSEMGMVESYLHCGLPGHHLKVRSLAWEGDTVFEQARMLNYPPLERQLDELGATVVVMQFGRMESGAGSEGLPAFITAYEALIRRLNPESKRRVALLAPGSSVQRDQQSVRKYREAIAALSHGKPGVRYIPNSLEEKGLRERKEVSPSRFFIAPFEIAKSLAASERLGDGPDAAFLALVSAKNRLWDRYRRPQNWAFLAGDRTTQASSRDHLDQTKRWFPEEMKEFVPLIEAKDREIWDLAAKFAPRKN